MGSTMAYIYDTQTHMGNRTLRAHQWNKLSQVHARVQHAHTNAKVRTHKYTTCQKPTPLYKGKCAWQAKNCSQ